MISTKITRICLKNTGLKDNVLSLTLHFEIWSVDAIARSSERVHLYLFLRDVHIFIYIIVLKMA